MRPIETPETDVTYGGVASKGIGDLPTQTLFETMPDQTIVKVHRSTWELEPIERAAFLLGSRLVLDVYGHAVPPVRLALSEPPDLDPPVVSALIDEAMTLAIASSISGVLRTIGVERDVATVASWSEEETKAVSDWLRAFGSDPSMILEAPAVLGLADDELRFTHQRRREATDG